MLFLEFRDDVFDDALVKVFTAQKGVAIGGQHFKLLLAIDIGNLDDGHVKRTATQVIHSDFSVAFFLLVQAESQRSGGGLVDDALHIQPGDAAGVFGGLALGVIKVGWHGDDGLSHGLAQIILGSFLHLAQYVGADLLRGHALAAHFHPRVTVVGRCDLVGHEIDVFLYFFLGELAANQALDGIQRVLRIGNCLSLGRCANQHFATILVGNDGRRGTCALRVFNHLGRVAFHDGDAGVGRAQVNSDNSSHDFLQ